jgi:acetoin utilization protein AcuB
MTRVEQKRLQIEHALDQLNGRASDRSLSVGAVMTPAPTCITTESTLLDIIRVYRDRQFRHLLVSDGQNKLVGVVSDRDVLRFLGPDHPTEESLKGITASEIMTQDVITTTSEAPLAEAISIMLDHGINCLPVEDNGRLIGILTSTDFYVALQVLLDKRHSNWRAPAVGCTVA